MSLAPLTAKDTVVNLAFDLIGFGKGLEAQNSQLTIRDLHLGLGVPQTTDDAATLAEDSPALIDALGNDLNAHQPGFTPVVVAGPAHGQVAVNADGSFGYTPEANWHGTDTFTYALKEIPLGDKLSDGHVDSNVATVTLTVTSVNDAPVLAGQILPGNEDTSITANLLATASDVEGDALSTAVLTGPQHGQLQVNDDGSFTYTPDANWNGSDAFTYKVNDGELDSTVATVVLNVAAVNDAPVIAPRTVTLDEDTSMENEPDPNVSCRPVARGPSCRHPHR